jgi:hypothetical protein
LQSIGCQQGVQQGRAEWATSLHLSFQEKQGRLSFSKLRNTIAGHVSGGASNAASTILIKSGEISAEV